MNEPIRTQWQIRCAFNGFCKRTLKNEAINAHRDRSRQQLREVSFSDLSPQEEKQLYTYDTYFADDEAEKSFCVAGKEITAKLLAEALRSLPEEKRDAVLGVPSQGQLRILRIGRCCEGSTCQFLYALFVVLMFPTTPMSV